MVPQIGKAPDVIVLVVTLRSLKMHGGVAKADLALPNADAVAAGFANVRQHVQNLRKFGVPVVMAVNRFATDAPDELELLRALAGDLHLPVETADVFAEGGAGGLELAEAVQKVLYPASSESAAPPEIAASSDEERTMLIAPSSFTPMYDAGATLAEKIETIAREVYRADSVHYSNKARKQLHEFQMRGWGVLPICVAKTQYSFSDDAKALGAPKGFAINVQELIPRLGAGFIVVRTGDIVTMPGLPKNPAGLHITLSDEGVIDGIS